MVFNKYEVICGQVPDISFLISVTGGLLYFTDNKMIQILECHRAYGISYRDNKWYVYCDHTDSGDHVGSIVSMYINNDGAHDIKNYITNIGAMIHQIDFIGDFLYIPDPHRNAITKYDTRLVDDNYTPKEKILNGEIVDLPKALSGDANYCHFNSIFGYDNKIFVLAQNLTNVSDKKSEIYVLNQELDVLDIMKLDASCAHNIYKDKDKLIVCDSLNYKVCDYQSNDAVLFESDGKFTRGLAIGEDYILVGGSTYSVDRKYRNDKDSIVYILDKGYNVVSKIKLNSCQINEIRLTDQIDYGLSNSIKL